MTQRDYTFSEMWHLLYELDPTVQLAFEPADPDVYVMTDYGTVQGRRATWKVQTDARFPGRSGGGGRGPTPEAAVRDAFEMFTGQKSIGHGAITGGLVEIPERTDPALYSTTRAQWAGSGWEYLPPERSYHPLTETAAALIEAFEKACRGFTETVDSTAGIETARIRLMNYVAAHEPRDASYAVLD